MNGLKSIKINRRELLSGSLLLGAGLCVRYGKSFLPPYRSQIPGSMVGPQFKIGHLLRQKIKRNITRSETVDAVIVGGGIAGLSAGWRFLKNDFKNFKLLELGPLVGGNSLSGQNNKVSYPWGAHYIPLPSADNMEMKILFEDFNIIQGYDSAGLPVYDEYAVVSDPHERLFIHGRWQGSLIPDSHLSKKDQSEFKEFERLMREFSRLKGIDGKMAFSIPVHHSSRDSQFLKFDQISFHQYLTQKGFTSPYLFWYANYCCRDDFGLTSKEASAWAGIHYFAARTGKGSGLEEGTLLTWPSGNGHIVHQLHQLLHNQIQTNQLVTSIEKVNEETYHVDAYNPQTKETTRTITQSVIFSAPRFTAPYIIEELKDSPPAYLEKFEYAPWMVANIFLKDRPQSMGTLCWDNVSYYGKSLGYVSANHQTLNSHPSETVLTFYYPLTDESPKAERYKAVKKTHGEWTQLVLKEMKNMHPDIEPAIEKIDVAIWGHGMIAPKVNFMWSREKEEAQKSLGNIHFAHSDMSGISLFEEAFYQGNRAALSSLKQLNRETLPLKSRGLF